MIDKKTLGLFKKKMKQYKTVSRSSTISHAFASALAPADTFDEQRLEEALQILGFGPNDTITCVYCGGSASTVDHLNGLVSSSKFTGHGHVIGNLVPACSDCNPSKGGKNWRDFCTEIGLSPEKVEQLTAYEGLAPKPTGEDELRLLYPDLMEAYQRVRTLIQEMLRTADNLANEIHRLESRRLERQFDDT